MPIIGDGTYRSHADLLTGGSSIGFDLILPDRRVRVLISVVEDVFHLIPGALFRVPESNALYLFPAFKSKLFQLHRDGIIAEQLRVNIPAQIFVIPYIFQNGNLDELQHLIETSQVEPLEKLKAFMAFCKDNIFANPAIPTSFRLISEATGFPPNQIEQLAREAPETFRIIPEQFLIADGGIDV
jgi:hypothetical protein